MRFAFALPMAVTAGVAACSSTPSDPASFEELYLGFNEIDAAIDSFPAATPAEVAAVTGTASYEGFAYVRDFTNGNLGGLRFMATGLGVVQADLDTLEMSGDVFDFYEIDLAQSNLNSTDPADYVTQPISGSLSSTSTADGWQGTLTTASGTDIAFDMQVYNTNFAGDNLEFLLIEADGTATINQTSIGTFEFVGHDDARGGLVD